VVRNTLDRPAPDPLPHAYFTRRQHRLGVMNPDTKLILDEMRKSFADNDIKLRDQEDRLSRQIQNLETAQEHRVAALEDVARNMDEWCTIIDGTVDGLRLQVKKLSLGWERASIENPGDKSGVFASSPSVAPRPSAETATTSPVVGHLRENNHRASGFGDVTTLIHSPVKGEHTSPNFQFVASNAVPDVPLPGIASHSKIPKVDFPKFDGEHPKLWLHDCVDYFSLYHVESSSWVRIARLHFVGAAKRWYNSVESQLQGCSWEQLSELILSRFGLQHHELLLRQLFQIRHIGTVDEYIEQFSSIVDQLGAYHKTTDPLFYTACFIDGLKDHIKATIHLHRPPNWDTACVLAKL